MEEDHQWIGRIAGTIPGSQFDRGMGFFDGDGARCRVQSRRGILALRPWQIHSKQKYFCPFSESESLRLSRSHPSPAEVHHSIGMPVSEEVEPDAKDNKENAEPAQEPG